MEFTEIDTVLGDTLSKGDIFLEEGEHYQVRRVGDDDGTSILASVLNLDTGDVEDDHRIWPSLYYVIFEAS